MTFFSIEFCTLFLILLPVYWLFKRSPKVQNLLILGFSYLFYALISPEFALILLGYSLSIYLMAAVIGGVQKARKALMLFCVLLCILCLGFFKYYDSLVPVLENVVLSLGFSPVTAQIILPVGMSFYVFASVTYLVAVYRGEKRESLIAVLTYLSFFPTLLMGPITRSRRFFKQYHAPQREIGELNLILTLLVFAAVKKLLLANYLTEFVRGLLDDPSGSTTIGLLNGIYSYSFLLYFDFSGYVDLVCALALLLGFRLPPNFKMPYISRNLKEFWKRWHISLSYFIRDYIYIPLGGSRKGLFITCLNLLIAMGLSGLWHGNTLNFLFWGLLHGLGLTYLTLTRRSPRFPKTVAVFINFSFVTFCWLFFYYKDSAQTFEYLSAFMTGLQDTVNTGDLMVTGLILAYFFWYQRLRRLKVKVRSFITRVPLVYKPILLALFVLAVLYVMPDGVPNFIYESF